MNIDQDYFHLFGVEKSYYPDMDTIKSNYRKLQRQFHPDKFTGSTAQEKLLAMQMTSFINDGFRIMQDEVARAEYILKISGVKLDDDLKTIQDTEFLQQQIILREELDELKNEAELNKFIDNMKLQIEKIGKDFAGKIGKDNAVSLALLQHLKFYSRLKQQAQNRI